jgi:hypothetical protein
MAAKTTEKPKHYAGSYQVDARNVKHAAAANPLTLCWRCHRTLDQHPPHRNGNPAYWTAGHTQHGSHTAQDSLLLVSTYLL